MNPLLRNTLLALLIAISAVACVGEKRKAEAQALRAEELETELKVLKLANQDDALKKELADLKAH